MLARGREALSTFGATFETGTAEDDSAVAACPEFIWPGHATGAIIITASAARKARAGSAPVEL